jgi:hypothetical protein
MLELDLGLNTKVGAYQNLHLLTKKREFFLLRVESCEFSNNSAPLSDFTKLML